MTGVINATDEDYNELIEDGLVFVDFHAQWCGPCKMIAPLLDDLAVEYAGRIKIAKADVDQCPKFSQEYRVRGIPTLVLLHNGVVQGQLVGSKTLGELRRFLNANLKG